MKTNKLSFLSIRGASLRFLKIKLLALALLLATIGNAQAVLHWAKSMGGSGFAGGNFVVCDANSNVYTTGSFSGTVDFDPGTGIQAITAIGDINCFISKSDAAGNLVWAKSFGGDQCIGDGVTLDGMGNIYITGYFYGTVDFDPGPGIQNLTAKGAYSDAFVVKLDAAGNLIWAKSLEGDSDDTGWTILVDATGNIYVSGSVYGAIDLDPGSGEIIDTPTINNAGSFIVKLDGSGNYLWSSFIDNCNGISLSLDSSGNVLGTGYFSGPADFDPTPANYTLTPAKQSDVFLTKLNTNGNLVWVKTIEGYQYNTVGLAVDAADNIYVTSSFSGTIDFDPGPGVSNLTAVSDDVFILKLDDAGNLVWAKSIGGPQIDKSRSIAVDNAGNVYTLGTFQNTADFNPGTGIFPLTSVNNSSDVFISKLDVAGNFVWAERFGNTYDEIAASLAVRGDDDIYITGEYTGTVDFDPGSNIQELTAAGNSDIFLMHLRPVFVPLTLLQFQACNNEKTVQLKWQTTQEENTASFAIERSATGKSFSAIGSVPAANIAFKNNYAFTDAQPLSGSSFYRLKMIDIDGSFTYSPTVLVRRTEGGATLLVSPSPAKDILYVQANGNEPVMMQLVDVNGRLLQQQKVSLNGTTSFSVNIQQLPAGSYYLILKGKTTQVKAFLKQ